MTTTAISTETIEHAKDVGRTIMRQVDRDVWELLRARSYSAITLPDGTPGLRAAITIRPFGSDGERSGRPRSARLFVTLRGDLYDITVQHPQPGDRFGIREPLVTHAQTSGVDAAQLGNALRALDCYRRSA